MMDIVLVVLLICALISAFAFNQGAPSTPEWNPLEMFFQGYLGWDLFKTTAFCSGILLFGFFILFVIGRNTGWSKGLWFDPSPNTYEDQDFNTLTYEQRVELGKAQNARVQASLFKPMIAVLVIAFVISLCKMGA
jgi:hypothetical protein